MNFDIPENLKHLISNVEYSDIKTIDVKFTHQYGDKEIASPFDVTDVPNSLKNFEKKLKQMLKDISNEEYNEIETVICYRNNQIS